MIYKTFSFPENPNAEYQFRSGNWYKRSKGSKDKFFVVDKNGQKKLNDYFTKKGLLFSYSTSLKVIVGLTLALVGFKFYQSFKK
jgi:hypothetical protein